MSIIKNYFKVGSILSEQNSNDIQELRQNHKIILEEINDGCFINQGGKVVFANRAFCTMHGYSPDEIIGKNCVDLLDQNTRDTIMEHFNKQLKEKVPFSRYVYLRQDKFGNKFFTENRAKLIRYNNKPAILGLCADITERMDVEEKQRQKESLMLIGRLTASIAHEIRNNLSAININLQILQDTLELQGNDRRRLEIVHEQFNHLGFFVSQMMEFAGPLRLKYDSVPIEQLIEEFTLSIRYRAQTEGVAILKKNSSNLTTVAVDKKKMVEAMENIALNAFEAMFGEDGRKNKYIELNAELKNIDGKNYADLSIRDNGTGIDPNDIDSIFFPFFTKGKTKGVGLGLSIVKRIIDAHQGFVKLESEKQKGTCFHLLIPVDRF